MSRQLVLPDGLQLTRLLTWKCGCVALLNKQKAAVLGVSAVPEKLTLSLCNPEDMGEMVDYSN